MAKTRDLKIVIAGDADKLDRELKRANASLDKLGKQTRLTASVSSKGYSAMRVGATGAAAGLAGLAVAGKSVVDASIDAEKSQARLEAQLKASNISYKAHAKEIDAVIQKHSQLAGLDDEDLQDAFTNVVRATGSVSVAMKDMALVSDLARGKNMDVAKAGELVAKIHAGSVGPLKRMGIEFVKTTDNVDKLRAAHAKATPAQVAAAKAADNQANSQRALGILQDRVRGQAEAYGKTTAGSVDRANVAFENLKETIGGKLSPTVEKVSNKVADFVNEMSDGTGQGGRFAKKLEDIWHEAKPIVTWIGRATKNVAEFTAEHPKVAKLAFAILGVGAALKTLKFISAVTGFSTLLTAGRGAAKTLKTILGRGGVAAGEAAAANAAEGMAGQMPKSLGARQGRISSSMRGSGRLAGRAFGVAAGVAALAAFAETDFAKKVARKVANALPGKNESAARSKWFDDASDSGMSFADYAKTHPIPKAGGGVIPGTGDRDTVPVLATPGEFMIRKAIVQKYGPTFFAAINDGKEPQRFSAGGIVSRAGAIDARDYPYVWGGGHSTTGKADGGTGRDKGIGFDCSGAVSAVLGVSPPRGSVQFMSWGKPGPGGPNDTKVFANSQHVFAVIDGKGWGTSRENPGGGPGWLSYNYRPGFTIRHIADGASTGGSSYGGDPQETSESGKATRSELAQRSGSRLVNRITARSAKAVGAATRRASAIAGVIEDADAGYSRSERFFGQVLGGQAGVFGDEDLGTATGRSQRTTELNELKRLKKDQLARLRKRMAALTKAVAAREKTLKALRKSRDRAHGAKRAKIAERIKPYEDRTIELQAELKALGGTISDTQLDIGDLDRDIADVAATEDTAGAETQSASDVLSQTLSDIDLQERAGVITADSARAQRISYLQRALGGEFGGLDQRQQWEVQAQLLEAQKATTEATSDLAAALKDVKASLDAQLAFANGVSAVTSMQAVRAMSDVISGQLGYRVGVRSSMPGSGALSRL